MTPDSAMFTLDFKKQLLEKVIGEDKSNFAKILLRLLCEAATADSQVKAKVWNKLIDPNSTSSINQKRA